jgi:TetR/AcrR family acrAB operon transcriptional repressor
MYVYNARVGTELNSATRLTTNQPRFDAAMARCTKEEAIETRNRILDAAEDIFHAQGVARTSLADVAEAANVTRGAIYWHFKNKDDLFDAMCQRVRLPMEAMMEAQQDGASADPLARLRDRCLVVLSETVNNPHSRKVFDILLHKCEFVDDADPIFARQKECYAESLLNIEKLVGDAVNQGQLPPDLDVKLAAVAVHAVLVGLMNNWLFVPETYSLASASEPIIDACIETLRYAMPLRKR